MGLLVSFLICFILNIAISMIFTWLIPNVYLASMLTSIVISFIYSLFILPYDRGHFYRYKRFWYGFLGMGIVFLLIDVFTFIL
jgi:hypothetical protein